MQQGAAREPTDIRPHTLNYVRDHIEFDPLDFDHMSRGCGLEGIAYFRLGEARGTAVRMMQD